MQTQDADGLSIHSQGRVQNGTGRQAGRLKVRGRQSGQAGGLKVRTGKGQNQEDEKKRPGKIRS